MRMLETTDNISTLDFATYAVQSLLQVGTGACWNCCQIKGQHVREGRCCCSRAQGHTGLLLLLV